jgi:hypothetical protein
MKLVSGTINERQTIVMYFETSKTMKASARTFDTFLGF